MSLYSLPENQRVFLDNFVDRAFNAFQFLENEYTGSTELEASFLKTESTQLKVPFYIFIQQKEKVYEYGEFKYSVQKGDVLEVLMRKTCRDGCGECWQVRNVKTGLTGYLAAHRNMPIWSKSATCAAVVTVQAYKNSLSRHSDLIQS